MDLFGESSSSRKRAAAISVSELNSRVREALEGSIGEVKVEGEVSNYRRQASGHIYFTLKDDRSQIRAVMFRGDTYRLRFEPEDGVAVQIQGELTVYEVRGEYQIRVRFMRPKGRGGLQERFEALKQKLMQEGLFDQDSKRSLPRFPERVGVVTSPDGAAVQDFLQVLERRCPRLIVQIYPARVQGVGSAEEVRAGVRALNRLGEVDVIVVCRGGGSLEDLWAFNDEALVRSVGGSEIPVISAVGHETDFTLCDFAADLRAPTPSAAAELVSQADDDWLKELQRLGERLDRAIQSGLERKRWKLNHLASHYVFKEPERMVEQYHLRVGELEERMQRSVDRAAVAIKARFEAVRERWEAIDQENLFKSKRDELRDLEKRLKLMSPQGTLERGYAIVFDANGKVIRETEEAQRSRELSVRLRDGEVRVDVRDSP